MKQSITSYEIIRHGIEYPDYFTGCGVSVTDFDSVQTGIGSTEKEAFEDAVECIASAHSIDEPSMRRLEWDGEHTEWSDDLASGDGDQDPPWWHVSIRYNLN